MNAPAPYRGKDKYIFISYSHKDTDRVYPIIARLNAEGYRVWYDSGIDPGTEWDENIAHHIEECGYFIAFISEHYLASNNCKDELNYVRDLEKERLIVYLESVSLPSGLAMRINRLQSIHKSAYKNEEDFYEKLFTAQGIEVCLGDGVSTAKIEQAVRGKVLQMDQKPTKKARVKVKTKKTAWLLALFLGTMGAHDFYLGFYIKGIIKLILMFTPVFYISTIWALIDFVRILCGKVSVDAKGNELQ